jgi:hypothetical protein
VFTNLSITAPSYVREIFTMAENRRKTRYTNVIGLKINIPRPKNGDYGKNCLSYLGATIWNTLDELIKECKS